MRKPERGVRLSGPRPRWISAVARRDPAGGSGPREGLLQVVVGLATTTFDGLTSLSIVFLRSVAWPLIAIHERSFRSATPVGISGFGIVHHHSL